MNFKPTILKSIISFISGIIVSFLFKPDITINCIRAPCPQPTWIQEWFTLISEPLAIIISLITILIVYIIWSLFQKK